MADYADYDFGDSSDEYSSEYPDCEPLTTNFYLYSYWWITIIAQVLLVVINFNVVVIIVVNIVGIIICFQILSFFLFAILWGFLSRSCPCLDKQDDVMPILYFQVTKVNVMT